MIWLRIPVFNQFVGEQAYEMGQQFVKDFSRNIDNLQEVNLHFVDTKERHQPSTAGEARLSSSSSSVMHKTLRSNLQPGGVGPMMQASVGSIPHPRSTPLPPQSSSQAPSSSASRDPLTLKHAFSKAAGRDPLTLKHAFSKSKLSRSTPSATSLPPKSETLHRAVSESGAAGAMSVSSTLQQEAVDFMVGVMDECTHLGNFSIPLDPSLIIIVAARKDAYIPRHGVIPLNKLWPGCEVRYLANRGHIAAFLLNNHVFRSVLYLSACACLCVFLYYCLCVW